MRQHLIRIAPMLAWTDRHCRYFFRLLSPRVFLYTEMITSTAILHGQRDVLLKYDPSERPLAIQLGGSNPNELAQCAQIAERYGYDEINLNVGCPSDRVQSGRFGACLMAEPELVASCIAAMQAKVKIPVTVKTRIGIDDRDSYEELVNFIQTVAATGCKTFIIHARKAWLSGLSPKENREVPPLRYDIVQQLKKDFPQLEIILNGGITSLNEIQQHLQHFDGVMLGRSAYHNPYLLALIDDALYPNNSLKTDRFKVLANFYLYIEQQLKQGVSLARMTKPILGLFQGMPGSRSWRRHLSENVHKADAGIHVLHEAEKHLSVLSKP